MRNPHGTDPNPKSMEIPLLIKKIPLLPIQAIVGVQTKGKASKGNNNCLSDENNGKDDEK